jgi:DNA-binding LacI/PurR family transcriptional regulator
MMKKGKSDASGSGWMTLADLARMAGVSQSTVSRALAGNTLISEKTRLKVQELARETGFSVNPIASSLRSKQSRIISVIIALVHERSQPLHDPFWMTMLAYLAESLTEAGYEMLLSKVEVHEDGWIEKIRAAQRPAGMILIGQSREHPDIDRAALAGFPIVVWGARLEEQNYPTVGSDNRGGGSLAVRHLLELGYRRIAFLGDTSLPEVAQRYAGYCEALAVADIAVDPALIIPSGFHPDHALESATRLIASAVGFDAVMAASDVIAISTIRALGAAGRRVPEDVAVVGFDDIQLASFNNPPLTTVRQDIAEGARLLVANVQRIIAGEKVGSVEMPSHLVIRQSTAARQLPRPIAARQ